MSCLDRNMDLLGPEKQIKIIWDFNIRICAWSIRMQHHIKEYIDGLWVYEHAEQKAVAEYIVLKIRNLYWDFWGTKWDVSPSDCTIELHDHGGSCYALCVEGPGPNDISIPITFSLRRHEHT